MRKIIISMFAGVILTSNSFGYYMAKQGRWLSRDHIEESGGENLYTFVRNSPITFLDFIGLLTSTEALQHYKTGEDNPKDKTERIPKRMSFGDIDTSSVKPEDLNQIKKILKECKPGTYQIQRRSKNDNLPFSTSGDQSLFLGDISLKIEGTLNIKNNREWSFKGTVKSFDDWYDFNASNHRGVIGEGLTWIGRTKVKGKPYWIEIRGTKKMNGTGDCCKNKGKSSQGGSGWNWY